MTEARTARGIDGPYGDVPEMPDPREPVEVSGGTLVAHEIGGETYRRFVPKNDEIARRRLLEALSEEE